VKNPLHPSEVSKHNSRKAVSMLKRIGVEKLITVEYTETSRTQSSGELERNLQWVLSV